MLTLSGRVSVAEDYFKVFPEGGTIYSLIYVKIQRHGQVMHELGARSDYIAVEAILDILLDPRVTNALLFPVLFQKQLLFQGLRLLLSSSESARSLLIHFSARGHAIDCHIQQLPGANDIHDFINVHENIVEHFCPSGWGDKR